MSDRVARVLEGAVDLHVHTTPSPFPRRFDAVEAARLAAEAGFRAIVVKSHHHSTVTDLLALQANKIRDAIEGFRTNYVLMDTPGQIELFVFRPSGKYLVDYLNPEKSVLAFLMDPFISKTPSGFTSARLLASSVQLRLGLPTANLLTKSDLLQDEELERLLAWNQDPDLLQSAFDTEEATLFREMNVDLYRVLGSLSTASTLYPTSAINLSGLEDLYTHVQQVVAGGEDILSD